MYPPTLITPEPGRLTSNRAATDTRKRQRSSENWQIECWCISDVPSSHPDRFLQVHPCHRVQGSRQHFNTHKTNANSPFDVRFYCSSSDAGVVRFGFFPTPLWRHLFLHGVWVSPHPMPFNLPEGSFFLFVVFVCIWRCGFFYWEPIYLIIYFS